MSKREWEFFLCECSYGQYVVRPKDDRSFVSKEIRYCSTYASAEKLCKDLNNREIYRTKTHNKTPLDQLVKYPEDL